MTRYNTHAIEGITLASFAFQESSHILSVLSKEYGRIKCVTKSSKKAQARSISPLLGVELLVVPSEKELWKCTECQVTASFPHLRTCLKRLRFATEVTDFLNKILPLHHPVGTVYSLYSTFLKELPNYEEPHKTACIFLEKLLIAEGMLEKESDPAQMDLGHYQRLLHTL